MHEEHETVEGHADEGYFDILTDPAHFLGELTYEGIFFILGALWVRWKLRKRDAEHNHTEIHNHYETKYDHPELNLNR